MCFKGEPKLILLCYNRKSKDNLNINFYDNNWNLLDLYRPKHPPSSIIFKKPKQFSKMMEYARVLSKDVPFLRVDFYEANEQLYFGELTFYPGSGYEKFVPDSYDYLLGSWIELPNERRYT
ncbi:MAG TPA: ATP-grasp fold amidoligase family protein, partial [Ignavibacteriales bacterium]|nr:ATP-grasp fold amidoligase family protein [Ignavibacteriales bacterium]